MRPEAEIALLIIAANGGEMTQDDARREWERVMSLSPEERAEWRRRIVPLAQAHARRHLAPRKEWPCTCVSDGPLCDGCRRNAEE